MMVQVCLWPTTDSERSRESQLKRVQVLLGKFFEQRFRILQVGGVESLGEPSIDLSGNSELGLFGPLMTQAVKKTPEPKSNRKPFSLVGPHDKFRVCFGILF